MLKYITNDNSLIFEVSFDHEWVMPPKTLGSVATIYLSLMLIKNNSLDSYKIDK